MVLHRQALKQTVLGGRLLYRNMRRQYAAILYSQSGSEMPIVQQSIALAEPPEQVWKVLTTIELLPLWLEGAQRVDSLTGPAKPGTRFTLRRAGSLHPEQWIVADWDPPHRLRYTEYQRNLQLRLTLIPAASGTQLTAAWETPRSRGMLEHLLQKTDRRMLESSLDRLRALLVTATNGTRIHE